MNRKEYLERCSAVAKIPRSTQGIRKVPRQLQVRYGEANYAPEGYAMYFSDDGSPMHYAILVDMTAQSSLMYAKLEQICEL